MPAKPPDRRRLRRLSIERRLALPAAEIAALSTTICGHLLQHFTPPPGRLIGFCWPVNNEADLRPALAVWRDAGAQSCLPVVVAENAALEFRVWAPDTPLVADRYGIPTPAAGDFVRPDVLLLPLNAFDAGGFRVGYGGGFFDRTLANSVPRPLAIGVGFELGRVASVAPQTHDQRLDWIVTEAGVFAPAR